MEHARNVLYGSDKMFSPPDYSFRFRNRPPDFSKPDEEDEGDEGVQVDRKLVWLRELSDDGEGDDENVD